MRISAAVDLFYLSMKTVRAPATIMWYRKKLDPFVEFTGDLDVDDIDLFVLEKFRSTLDRPSAALGRTGNVSNYTVHGYVRALKRFFNWMKFRRLIKDNPAEYLEKPRLPKQPRKGISLESAQKMLSIAEEESRRDYAMLMFFRDTGCRAGGIYNLLTSDLDIDHNIATVHEKGDKERIVFFTSETALAMARYKLWRENPKGLPQFFLTEDNRHNAMNYRGVYEVFRRLAQKAGVSGTYSPHQWRHAAARSWIRAGMNLKVVSEILGHSGVKVTGDIYGTSDENELHALYDQTQKRILAGM